MITAGTRGRLRGSRGSRRTRRGAAAVELAVVAPLLLAMVFGVMEFGWTFMTHETITHATREACRRAVLQGSSPADAQAVFTQAIAPTGLTSTADVVYSDNSVPPDGVNETVTVSVNVPYSEVSITGLASWLKIDTATISATCSMRREGM